MLLKFIVDLSGVESADDGSTTYYGGSYTVNGKVGNAYGNDRGDNWQDDVASHVLDVFAEHYGLSDKEIEEMLDNEEVNDKFHDSLSVIYEEDKAYQLSISPDLVLIIDPV